MITLFTIAGLLVGGFVGYKVGYDKGDARGMKFFTLIMQGLEDEYGGPKKFLPRFNNVARKYGFNEMPIDD